MFTGRASFALPLLFSAACAMQVEDGQSEYGLEISGTLTEEVEARHRAKVSQLLDNPYGVDGYVVVVGFATRSAIFSYHRFQETA